MKVLQQSFFAYFFGFYAVYAVVLYRIMTFSSSFGHGKADREETHGLAVEKLWRFLHYAAFFSE